jgi:hypothetical protein
VGSATGAGATTPAGGWAFFSADTVLISAPVVVFTRAFGGTDAGLSV